MPVGYGEPTLLTTGVCWRHPGASTLHLEVLNLDPQYGRAVKVRVLDWGPGATGQNPAMLPGPPADEFSVAPGQRQSFTADLGAVTRYEVQILIEPEVGPGALGPGDRTLICTAFALDQSSQPVAGGTIHPDDWTSLHVHTHLPPHPPPRP